jgi:hypothetical protein
MGDYRSPVFMVAVCASVPGSLPSCTATRWPTRFAPTSEGDVFGLADLLERAYRGVAP